MKQTAWSRIAVMGLLLALTNSAWASFHFMQIEQVIGGVEGNVNAQAIQLRMRANGQNLVNQARIRAWDAAGENPVVVIDMLTNVPNGSTGSRVLIASEEFLALTDPETVPDFMMTSLIPESYLAAGSLTFESNGGTVYWRLSWGGDDYTGSGSVQATPFGNDADGDANPPYPDPLPTDGVQAVQFQGPATALSTNNADQYALTDGAATFINNAAGEFTVVESGGPVTVTIFFDNEGPEKGITFNGQTGFSYEGSTWAGGFVATFGVFEFYASGLQSYHFDMPGQVQFDEPIDSVDFFYVDGGPFPPGTATAFDAADNEIGSVDSNIATVFADPANFESMDPAAPIARIEFSGGVVDNFTFTTQIVDDEQLFIVSTFPPNDAIDARQPTDLSGDNADGFTAIDVTFDNDPAALTPADFTVSEAGGDGVPPGITSVTVTDVNTVTVEFDSIIEVDAWTTLTVNSTGESTRVGYLPGDANGDGTSSASDVLALINGLNDQKDLAIYSSDIDRSGVAGAADVLRLIDLLNGAGAFDVFLGQQLPD